MGGMDMNSQQIEGRHAVAEALRAGHPVDKLYVLEGCKDGPVSTIVKEARKGDAVVQFVSRERLDQLSETKKHQGVIARMAAYAYASVEDILEKAKKQGEPPFVFLLDGVEDPYNLGAVVRTADQVGAHGVIILKNRAVGLTASAARASAGALNYVPVARVTNLARTVEQLKKQGIWFVCGDMGGQPMYQVDMKGPLGLVVGGEGGGVSRLVREACDYTASIPMKGHVDSLNASVAAGVLAYEAFRQRMGQSFWKGKI